MSGKLEGPPHIYRNQNNYIFRDIVELNQRPEKTL